jgi:glycosyltransferase involved in cell wall biosynthesis
MKIGIYVEAVNANHKTGISRYIIGLVEALSDAESDNTFYLYYQNYPKNTKLNWLKNRKNVVHRAIWAPKDLIGEHPNLWWKYYLPFWLKLDCIDVFHGPNHAIPLKGNIPTVVTIHDLAYYFMEVHGNNMDKWLQQLTNLNMATATKVIAISKATARDCVALGVDSQKVDVIYQGFERCPQREVDTSLLNRFKLNDTIPYLLFLGTLQPRKNPIYLVKEFAKVIHQLPHKLVLAGAAGESSDEIHALVEKLGLSDRVVFTDYINDDERHALYHHASIFLYPSKYEGFGLVVLEAMSYGVPVITSKNSALVESAGDAAILINIQKSGACAKAILNIALDDTKRDELITKGFAQANKFNWQDGAESFLKIYQELNND